MDEIASRSRGSGQSCLVPSRHDARNRMWFTSFHCPSSSSHWLIRNGMESLLRRIFIYRFPGAPPLLLPRWIQNCKYRESLFINSATLCRSGWLLPLLCCCCCIQGDEHFFLFFSSEGPRVPLIIIIRFLSLSLSLSASPTLGIVCWLVDGLARSSWLAGWMKDWNFRSIVRVSLSNDWNPEIPSVECCN